MHDVERWVCEQINQAGLHWREAKRDGEDSALCWLEGRIDAWAEVLACFGQEDDEITERIALAKGIEDD